MFHKWLKIYLESQKQESNLIEVQQEKLKIDGKIKKELMIGVNFRASAL